MMDIKKLKDRGLPICNTDQEIAIAMDISLEKLHFLAFNSFTSTTKHYFFFSLQKKTGEPRIISTPIPNLKTAQKWILKNILDKLDVHDAAHGFRRNRSIITNAKPHLGSAVILKLDLENFFQSIYYKRVKDLFIEFGYSERGAKIFALICTIADLENRENYVNINNKNQTKRCLPQGSPASPAISNLICDRLDTKLTQIAQENGFCYTRYADDLTFSSPEKALDKLSNLLQKSQLIITQEGFKVNRNKTQILSQSVQQKVTGIVVNSQLNISRKTLKAFRATLYQIEQEGLSSKTWGNSDNVMAAITGFANYVAMVNPSKGAEFLATIERIKQKYE